MPRRVEAATPSSFITRRSTARAIRPLTSTKLVTTTRLLNSDQSEKCPLPGTRSTASSAVSMAVYQPTSWRAITAHTSQVRRISQQVVKARQYGEHFIHGAQPLCIEIRYELAFEQQDLVLERQLAFLQTLELQLVDVEIQRQARDDLVQVTMFNAQVPQLLHVAE